MRWAPGPTRSNRAATGQRRATTRAASLKRFARVWQTNDIGFAAKTDVDSGRWRDLSDESRQFLQKSAESQLWRTACYASGVGATPWRIVWHGEDDTFARRVSRALAFGPRI